MTEQLPARRQDPPFRENLPAVSDNVRDRTWLTRRLNSTLLLSQADFALLNALRPRCARCNKPVDTIEWTLSSTTARSAVFTVHCHGATETMTVGFDMVPIIMAGGVQGAEAFREPDKLEHERKDDAGT